MREKEEPQVTDLATRWVGGDEIRIQDEERGRQLLGPGGQHETWFR